jgi:hypothetical protein
MSLTSAEFDQALDAIIGPELWPKDSEDFMKAGGSCLKVLCYLNLNRPESGF